MIRPGLLPDELQRIRQEENRRKRREEMAAELARVPVGTELDGKRVYLLHSTTRYATSINIPATMIAPPIA
jgi:hypothetical protein